MDVYNNKCKILTVLISNQLMSSTTSDSTGDNVTQNATIKAVVPMHIDDTDGPLKSITIADYCSCWLYCIIDNVFVCTFIALKW